MDILKWIVISVAMLPVIQAGRSRIIDLTHQLKPDIPVHPVYPKFNFTKMYRGKFGDAAWIEYNWFGTVEHIGTHMDAPAHFSRDGMKMHEVPVERFIGPGVVIRVTEKARHNPDYQLTIDDILEWEAKHGQIPDNAIVMMDSGWTHKFSNAESFFGTYDISDASTFHFPSISPEAADFIANYRKHISILGVDTISLDPGATTTYPVHVKLQPLGYVLLENLAHLDQVPEAGAVIYCLPLNIYDGSGSPIRALAVIRDDVMHPNVLQASASAIIKMKLSYVICLLGALTVNMLQ